jgi:hypothetical protein
MGRGAGHGGGTNKKGDDMKLVDGKDEPKPDEIIVQIQTKSGNPIQMNLGPLPYMTAVEKVRNWMNERQLIANEHPSSSGFLWSDQIDSIVVILRSELEKQAARQRLAGR